MSCTVGCIKDLHYHGCILLQERHPSNMFWKKKLKERKIKIPVEACEWMIEGNRPQIGHHIESNLQPLTYFKKIHYLVSS